MPIADMLVDAAAGHKVLSFLDGKDDTVPSLQYPLSEKKEQLMMH